VLCHLSEPVQLEPGLASPRFAGMFLLVFPFGFDGEPNKFFAFIRDKINSGQMFCCGTIKCSFPIQLTV
jgi:hypothetical protein